MRPIRIEIEVGDAGSKDCGVWRLGNGRLLSLDKPRIIGILNVTPDSFADGGQHVEVSHALAAAQRMAAEGADMLDIGGESTRPGAQRVSASEQVRRVVPVIQAIRRAGVAVPISIDTTLAVVAVAAIDAGADAINDVSAGTESENMFEIAAARGVGLILMHRRNAPPRDSFSDQYVQAPRYADVVDEVKQFLADRAQHAMAAGVAQDSIVLDPGLGFGKSVEQNLELIARTSRLADLGFPILSALSRKSFVGRVTLGRDSAPGERLAGTLALSVSHLHVGARLFRVHDVKEHRKVLQARL